jgi:hypothetical protein
MEINAPKHAYPPHSLGHCGIRLAVAGYFGGWPGRSVIP